MSAARVICLLTGIGIATCGHAQPAARPEVDVARIIAAMDVCLKAPPGRDETFAYARTQGFGDLPAEQGRNFPFPAAVPLVRSDVWLRASSPNFVNKSGGSCEVLAPVAKGTAYAPIVQTLQAKFGQPGALYTSRDKSVSNQHWTIDGRYVSASLIGGDLEIYVGMPEPTDAQVAAAKQAEKQRDAEQLAKMKALAVPSPSADFGVAALACAKVLGPKGLEPSAIEADGWAKSSKPDSRVGIYTRNGSALRIFLSTMFAGSGQCVVDGYGLSDGKFNEIAKEVETQLRTVYGDKIFKGDRYKSPTGFSDGQAFGLDKSIIMTISSEHRPVGLSIRITSMRIPK